MHFRKPPLVLLLSLLLSQATAHAKDIELRYPELEVSPRASKRLMIEAKKEQNNSPAFQRWMPAIAASSATLLSSLYIKGNVSDYGFNSEKESDAESMANYGAILSAGWLSYFTYLAYKDRPYQEAYKEVRDLPHKTKSEDLTRERLAEEKINDIAKRAQKLMFLSTVTNVMFSAAMTSYAKNDGEIITGLATLISFAPYFYQNYWQSVSDRHEEYKKKIYGPVSMPFFKIDKHGKATTGMQVTLRF